MHWFWRAAIAIVAGTVSGFAIYTGVIQFHFGRPASGIPFFIDWAVAMLGLVIVPQIVAIRAYLALTRRFDPPRRTDESYCRKCGYILRGITEPRCSECGERI